MNYKGTPLLFSDVKDSKIIKKGIEFYEENKVFNFLDLDFIDPDKDGELSYIILPDWLKEMIASPQPILNTPDDIITIFTKKSYYATLLLKYWAMGYITDGGEAVNLYRFNKGKIFDAERFTTFGNFKLEEKLKPKKINFENDKNVKSLKKNFKSGLNRLPKYIKSMIIEIVE